jgi:SPP1 gp7 family putative phage head morphogenesis protein
MTASPAKLPFQEAMEHFRQKETLPFGSYEGVDGTLHERAFVVANLALEDVLGDLMDAVDRGIADGTSTADFRKEFVRIIEGRWEPAQDRGWRARVILETNVKTAYAAGRYRQMTEMKETHPYWQYRIGVSVKHRPEHEALDGKVLMADDPWWDANYPPNGWNCRCYVTALTEGEMRRKGLSVASGLPDAAADPTWRHAHGRQTAHWPMAPPGGVPSGPPRAADETEVELGGYADPGLLQPMPARQSLGARMPYDAGLGGAPAADRWEGCIRHVMENVLGGRDRATFALECGGVRKTFALDAVGFGGHLAGDPGRLAFLGYLPDALAPQELWTDFRVRIKNGRRGRATLTWKALSRVDDPSCEGVMLLLRNNGRGEHEAYDFYPLKKIDKKRRGRLMAKAGP